MSGYIPVVDRMQAGLFPESLDDYVAADNLVRVIDAFVDGLDMAALGFARATPAAEGRPGYDPRLFLKLYLYGYLHRVRSSRRLEHEAHRNLDVLWLLGRAMPDHKTISEFRKIHAKALKAVFRQFTLVCRDLGLLGGALVAIDGSKVRAVNGKDQSFTPLTLRKLLQRIDAHTKEYLATLAAADRSDDALGIPSSVRVAELTTKLEQLQARQQKYQALLADLEETGATQVTLTDPESRRMKVKQGTEVCYNGQIAVDDKHHLIVSAEVTNDVTDVHQLSVMAAGAKDVLGVEHLAVVADRGYHNGPEIVQCLASGITPTVPQPHTSKNERAGRFTKMDFHYDAGADAYRCPGNALLAHQFTTTERGEQQRYYANAAACAACPLRAQCTSGKHRRIKRWEHEDLLEAMEARLRADPDSMTRRKSLVEHPFGTIKRWHDGSYFLLRGLAKVGGEFSLMTLAYNLRRVINILGVPKLLAALATAPARAVMPGTAA